jgi:hypothetical protein
MKYLTKIHFFLDKFVEINAITNAIGFRQNKNIN